MYQLISYTFHVSWRRCNELRLGMAVAVVGRTSCLPKFLHQTCHYMPTGDLPGWLLITFPDITNEIRTCKSNCTYCTPSITENCPKQSFLVSDRIQSARQSALERKKNDFHNISWKKNVSRLIDRNKKSRQQVRCQDGERHLEMRHVCWKCDSGYLNC